MLYKEDMDKMSCGHCHEGERSIAPPGLFFHGRCHVSSPTWTHYSDGILTVTCAECGEEIVIIAVASKP